MDLAKREHRQQVLFHRLSISQEQIQILELMILQKEKNKRN